MATVRKPWRLLWEWVHIFTSLASSFSKNPLSQTPKCAGYDELRPKLPLAAGEVLDSRAAAKQLIDRRVMDIIQPDLSLCGGLGEALFIAKMAALSGVRYVPHCWGSDILIAASIHLLLLLPEPHWGSRTETPLLEFDQSENPWRSGLATEPFKICDGFITVPGNPGLGIEIDEQIVKRYSRIEAGLFVGARSLCAREE